MRMTTIAFATMVSLSPAHAQTDRTIEQIVGAAVSPMLPANGAGGVAVALRIDGRTLFFNHGYGDTATKRPVDPDSLFNLASLRKVFEATLLADAVLRGEINLDDPVANYVPELQRGGHIRKITVGELATHTSGLLLPQDHPPWPDQHYTLEQFIDVLNDWHADPEHTPGRQHMYTHAGYVLLQLALERRFKMPIWDLMNQRVLRPLGLGSTVLPKPDAENVRGALDPALLPRTVQGYDENGGPIGELGDIQGYYLFAGTGQMYASARDLDKFLAANLGEAPVPPTLQRAMRLAQRGAFPISPRNEQALAWEVNHNFDAPVVEKNGGLDNSSTYLGMMPGRRIGLVLLCNVGNADPVTVGRRIISEVAAHARPIVRVKGGGKI
jgi:beta-lactamase class C